MRWILMTMGGLLLAVFVSIGVYYSFIPESGVASTEVEESDGALTAAGQLPAVSPKPVAASRKVNVSGTSRLSLKITGIRNGDGTIYGAVFAERLSFTAVDFNNAWRTFTAEAREGEIGTTLDLPSGEYALFLFHDENDNGDMEMEGMIPVEGYAYSNNVGRKSMPSFNNARFNLGQNGTEQSLAIVYQR